MRRRPVGFHPNSGFPRPAEAIRPRLTDISGRCRCRRRKRTRATSVSSAPRIPAIRGERGASFRTYGGPASGVRWVFFSGSADRGRSGRCPTCVPFDTPGVPVSEGGQARRSGEGFTPGERAIPKILTRPHGARRTSRANASPRGRSRSRTSMAPGRTRPSVCPAAWSRDVRRRSTRR